MVASESQSIVDFYPIVVELDDETLDSCGSNSASIYKTVASEASWFDSERSSRWDEERVQSDILTRESEHDFPPSPPSVKRSQMHDGDEFGRNTEVGSVFATIRSLLQLGYDREHDETNMDGKMTIEPLGSNPAPKAVHCSKASPISPIPSPNRVVTKRYRPKRFHDDYVLTRQIVQCRIATLWECVHRTTGRRFCAKAIDKRRFGCISDLNTAAREINMHRLILQSSPPPCLPRVRDIFADGEVVEQIQQQDESMSVASCCSEGTKSVGSHAGCEDSRWYIVQDFEAGGGNLGLYLLGREKRIFDVPENGENENVGTEIVIKDDLNFQAENSQAALMTMQESEVRSLARSLLLAMNELHRRSICHNDICPENILVPISPTKRNHIESTIQCDTEGTREGKEEGTGYVQCAYRHRKHQRTKSQDPYSVECWEDLKLCDLGRAFFVEQTSDENCKSDVVPRHSSLYYTSPEVIRGHAPSLASDMWSVGVILYRCFAGELPFREQSLSSTTAAPIKMNLRQQLKEDICRAKCNYGRSSRRKTNLRWSRVSRGAIQFLSALLNPSPFDRMTCDEALLHPWLMSDVSPSIWSAYVGPSIMPRQHSPSISLAMKPSMKTSTRTNHYHHHPKHAKVKETLNIGRTNYQEEARSTHADGSAGSPSRNRPTKKKQSLVHKVFGRLKTFEKKKEKESYDDVTPPEPLFWI